MISTIIFFISCIVIVLKISLIVFAFICVMIIHRFNQSVRLEFETKARARVINKYIKKRAMVRATNKKLRRLGLRAQIHKKKQ
jgi:hypothetical protein